MPGCRSLPSDAGKHLTYSVLPAMPRMEWRSDNLAGQMHVGTSMKEAADEMTFTPCSRHLSLLQPGWRAGTLHRLS